MRRLVLVTLTLALTSCAATTDYAVYKHPVTGDVMECELLHSGWLGSNVPTGRSAGPYADCKTQLEERGYQQVGTVERKRQATSPEEARIPRPALRQPQ